MPTTYNGQPVVAVDGFGNRNSNSVSPYVAGITHIFWAGAKDGTCKLRIFLDGAFRACNIAYLEIPDSVRYVADYAVANCTSLCITNFGKNVCVYASNAFANSLIGENNSPLVNINIPGSCTTINGSAFARLGSGNANGINVLTFGGSGDPTQITSLVAAGNSGAFHQRMSSTYAAEVHFYYTDANHKSRLESDIVPNVERLAGVEIQWHQA